MEVVRFVVEKGLFCSHASTASREGQRPVFHWTLTAALAQLCE